MAKRLGDPARASFTAAGYGEVGQLAEILANDDQEAKESGKKNKLSELHKTARQSRFGGFHIEIAIEVLL